MLLPANLRDTVQAVGGKLNEAKACQYMLFIYIDIVREESKLDKNNILKKRFPRLFLYSFHALKTRYILTLYDLFDKDGSLKTLRKMINILNNLNTKKFGIDAELYRKFKKKSYSILEAIEENRIRLISVRDKKYAHSEKEIVTSDVDMNKTEKWLTYAEDIFKEATDLVGLNSNFNDVISINQELKKEIDLLNRLNVEEGRS